MSGDPLGNIGKVREPLKRPPNTFWQPNSPERVVAKLDRIDTSRLGDFAAFRGVVVRVPDGFPLRSGEIRIGLSGAMRGRLTPHDSGSWCIIEFQGWDGEKDSKNRTRLFSVRIASGDEVKRVKDFALAAHEKLVSMPPAPTDNQTGEDDDLPF